MIPYKVYVVFGQTSDQYGTEKLLAVCHGEGLAEFIAGKSKLRTRIQEVETDTML